MRSPPNESEVRSFRPRPSGHTCACAPAQDVIRGCGRRAIKRREGIYLIEEKRWTRRGEANNGRIHYLDDVSGLGAAIKGGEELELPSRQSGRAIIRLSLPQLAVNRHRRRRAAAPSVRLGQAGIRPASACDVGGYEMHICSDRADDEERVYATQESVFWIQIIRRPFLAWTAPKSGAISLDKRYGNDPFPTTGISPKGPPRNRARQVKLHH